MSTGMAKKLLLLKARRVLILNEPAGYTDSLKGELPGTVQLVTEPAGNCDFVHLFVKDSSELRQLLGTALKSLETGGILWVSYPKKTSKLKSDLHRDFLVSLLHEYRYEGVSLVSIDDTWSAMRARPVKIKCTEP